MAAGRSSPKVHIDIRIEAGDWPAARGLRALVARTIRAALAEVPGARPGAEVSVLFTDDARMAKLNADWRGKQKTTNVLSFPTASASRQNRGFRPFLGDIVLAFETIRRESRQRGLKFEDHLTHLVLHGFLHLVGFDHAKNDEADRMEGLETAILGGLGIKDPHGASRASARPRRRR